MTAWWRTAYRRAVRDAFATVPLYRERWALDGRTDPVLVPGKLGTDGGAVGAAEIARRLADLVPIGGGERQPDPVRGLGPVLPPHGERTLVVVLDTASTRPPADLRPGARGCVVDPGHLSADLDSAVAAEVSRLLRTDGTVLAVGTDENLARFTDTLPAGDGARVRRVPVRTLDRLGDGPHGVLHDPLLGYLGSLGDCGAWHVDWRRVYVRETSAGLAFTVLHQRSPRLVDVLAGGGVPGTVSYCARHATPVVST